LLEPAKIVEHACSVFGADTGAIHSARTLAVPVIVLIGQSQGELDADAGMLHGPGHYSYVPELACRDQDSIHALRAQWIATCSRGRCALPLPRCIVDVDVEPVTAALLAFALHASASSSSLSTF
jgi:hypothetical protein